MDDLQDIISGAIEEYSKIGVELNEFCQMLDAYATLSRNAERILEKKFEEWEKCDKDEKNGR